MCTIIHSSVENIQSMDLRVYIVLGMELGWKVGLSIK